MISLEDVKNVFPLFFCVLTYFKFVTWCCAECIPVWRPERWQPFLAILLTPNVSFLWEKRYGSILQTLLFLLVDPLFNSTFYFPHSVITLGNCFSCQDPRVLCIKSRIGLILLPRGHFAMSRVIFYCQYNCM